jgi:hypothetical protein
MKTPYWLVQVGVGLTLLAGLFSGCAATPTSIQSAPPAPASSTASPSSQPLASLTSLPPASATHSTSPSPSLTPTPRAPDASATATPTLTLTPSLTATPTLSYNLPGLYPVGRCKDFRLTYADPAGGSTNYTGTVSLCVATVLVRDDFKLQFNVVYHFASKDVPVPHRYVFGHMDNMSLTDDLGNRYVALANSGQAPDTDDPGYGENSTGGWYLFPRPNKAARAFTLHDDDQKIDIPFIILVYR